MPKMRIRQHRLGEKKKVKRKEKKIVFMIEKGKERITGLADS